MKAKSRNKQAQWPKSAQPNNAKQYTRETYKIRKMGNPPKRIQINKKFVRDFQTKLSFRQKYKEKRNAKAVQNSIVFWRLKSDRGVERNPGKDRVAQKWGRAKPEGNIEGNL